MNEFEQRNADMISRMEVNSALRKQGLEFLTSANEHEYSYHFSWMGRPIIQYPQDIVATQELIWSVKPDLIIETGIAHGGSLIFSSSMLELIGGDGEVIGIDIEIREHNRKAIEEHPMFKRITLIEGSSISEEVAAKVHALAKTKKRVMVFLDSNHAHDHVLREMELYSPLVTKGSYMIVFDTVIEDLPAGSFPNRPWDRGSNPKTAVWQFLKQNSRFEVDHRIDAKLLVSVAPEGYLRCISD